MFVTLRPFLLLAVRLLLYMGIALLAVAAFQVVVTDVSTLVHHLMPR